MSSLWLAPALIVFLSMSAAAPVDNHTRVNPSRVPFRPMTRQQKNRFLASKFVKKKASNAPDVFSVARMADPTHYDWLAFYEAGSVSQYGTIYDSTALAATYPSATLIYNPTDASKSHLVVASFTTVRAGSFTLADSRTGQNTSSAVGASASGNIAIIEPAGASLFNVTLSPDTPANAVFVFKQISVEEIQ